MEIALYVVGWIALGLAGAGFWFAHLQRKYPNVRTLDFTEDKYRAVLFGLLFGPVDLIISAVLYSHYGWLWPWSDKARKEAGL